MLIQYMLYIYLLFILGSILENSTGDRGNLHMVFSSFWREEEKASIRTMIILSQDSLTELTASMWKPIGYQSYSRMGPNYPDNVIFTSAKSPSIVR